MYRGVSKLLGMDILEVSGDSIGGEIRTLSRNFGDYDFFYLHVKKTDSYGEDGDFGAKVGVGAARGFSESSCLSGGLGIIRATEIMPLLLAHAGRLRKFGA